jgi:hypothetical protein
VSGAVPQMSPLDRRAEHRAQHVMDVIDRLRRVARVHQMRHVRLHRLPRRLDDGRVPKLRQQMLAQDVPVILLRGCLVHRDHRRLCTC